VRLALRAREETRFSGRIRQISPVVDTASGTVKVTVEAVRPPAAVRPGAFVTVEVLRETRPDVVLVPRPAVIRELQETYVFVAEGKVARKRVVSVGLEEGDRLEIRAGLEAGEQVITAGQGGLKDLSPIAVAAPGAKS
jgi:membrane fusion protein (multidrug efflux system)